MAPQNGLRAAAARLAHIASTAPDYISAQKEALTVLRHVVPFDFATFSTIDPSTVLWTGCVLDGIGRDASRETFIFDNEYRHDDLHKIAALARGPEPVGRLSAVDPIVRAQSHRFQALRSLGVADELRCALLDGANCWGSLELYRRDDAGHFTAADARAAAWLAEPFARLVRVALLRQAAFRPASVDDPPGIVVLGRDGAIEAISAAGDHWLEDIGAESPLAVPPAIRSLAMKVGSEGDVALSMMVARMSGGWLRLHATRLQPDIDHRVSIVLEPVKSPVLPETLAQLYSFTPRECEVVTCIARGLSAKEIGFRLGLSPFTVNDYTKAVFQKAGVQSRQQLVATLFFDSCLPLRERGAIPGPYGWFLK